MCSVCCASPSEERKKKACSDQRAAAAAAAAAATAASFSGICTMNEPASSGNGQDFDVFSVMDWKDGIGTLPGSDLKFRVNEFGALEVITDETEMESVKKATATTTWMVPTAQEAFLEKTEAPPKLKETTTLDGLHFCESCSHSGTTVEFVAGERSCSQKCAHQFKNKEQQENKDISEFNDEDCSKGTQKRKSKLPLKGEYMDDRDKKDKETIMATHDPFFHGGCDLLKRSVWKEMEQVSFPSTPEVSFPSTPELLAAFKKEENTEGRILRVSQRATRKRKREMAILKQTLMSKGKKAWSWSSYLEEEKATAAPPTFFKEVCCPRKS